MSQFKNKEVYVQNLFNSIADNYDVMNGVMTWGMLPRWQKYMLKKTGLASGDKGLDVCCGTGELALQMKDMVGGAGEVTGLDFSENMLEVAREKVKNQSVVHVDFVQGDAMDLPFEDNQFDAITNGFALRNVNDIQQTINEMARVAKPGGRVVVLEVSRPLNPVFRAFFNVYFFKVVPLIGHAVDKKREIDGKFPAYTWLAESLKAFPHQDELKVMFENAGLEQVQYKGLGFGASTVHWGIKPMAEESKEV